LLRKSTEKKEEKQNKFGISKIYLFYDKLPKVKAKNIYERNENILYLSLI
jgi:hypothetical protein